MLMNHRDTEAQRAKRGRLRRPLARLLPQRLIAPPPLRDSATSPLRHFISLCFCASLLPLLLAPGCAKEEKVTHYKPFFTGLEGAEHRTAPVVDGRTNPTRSVAQDRPAAASDPGVFESEIKHPDGTITLRSPSGLYLMRHIERCLAEDDDVLFAEQVISEQTRKEFIDRGRDPKEALGMLKPREREISKLFGRLPMGEHSPNVIMEPIGRNIFRVRLIDYAAKGLEGYTGFDMVLEPDGNWRLRWFF